MQIKHLKLYISKQNKKRLIPWCYFTYPSVCFWLGVVILGFCVLKHMKGRPLIFVDSAVVLGFIFGFGWGTVNVHDHSVKGLWAGHFSCLWWWYIWQRWAVCVSVGGITSAASCFCVADGCNQRHPVDSLWSLLGCPLFLFQDKRVRRRWRYLLALCGFQLFGWDVQIFFLIVMVRKGQIIFLTRTEYIAWHSTFETLVLI